MAESSTPSSPLPPATPAVVVAPSAPVKLNGFDLALVAVSAVVPLALQVLGHVPNPVVAGMTAGLSALWAVCKTYLASRQLGTRADVQRSTAALLAAIEKATGHDVFKPSVESAIESGVGAAAEGAGLTVDSSNASK